MAYATVADLENRWRELSPEESEKASVLLDDAAVLLEQYAAGADSAALRIVSCNMVKRAMTTNGDALGLGQPMETVEWLGETPIGDLRLYGWEIKMLKGSSVGTAQFADLR